MCASADIDFRGGGQALATQNNLLGDGRPQNGAAGATEGQAGELRIVAGQGHRTVLVFIASEGCAVVGA